MSNIDAVLREVADDIRKLGLSVITVPSDGTEPTLAYSVGLWGSYHHPEIVVFGLPPEVGHTIINDIGLRVKSGKRFRDGDIIRKLANLPMAFVKVPKDRFEGHLTVALTYYEHAKFPALQLVWPNRQCRFPWQSTYDEKLRRAQPSWRDYRNPRILRFPQFQNK
jgi:Domain of unknown function (DUF4262)